MDWLTRIPVLGPAVEWFFTTRLWRVYTHLGERKWSRLAAAITFTSFLALFPMLAVGAAIGAAFLSPSRMRSVQDTLADQVPGISDQLDLQSLVDNAGTVGVIAGAALLFTGAGWVGTLREGLRALWDLEEDPGNAVLLRLKDLGALIGLGVAGVVSMGASVFAVSAVSWTAERIGLTEGGVGTVLLRIAGYAAAVVADFLVLWYVLTLLPRVRPPRRAMLAACLMGAVGFELLKALLSGYLQGVAAKSMYGTFGVPIALLLWISFMAKLLLFCAAWTATGPKSVQDAEPLAPDTPDTSEGAETPDSEQGEATESGREDQPGGLGGRAAEANSTPETGGSQQRVTPPATGPGTGGADSPSSRGRSGGAESEGSGTQGPGRRPGGASPAPSRPPGEDPNGRP